MRDNHFDQFVVAFKGVRSNTFHLPAASFHSMASLQLPPIPIRLSVLLCSAVMMQVVAVLVLTCLSCAQRQSVNHPWVPSYSWYGLATLSHPFTWTYYPSINYVVQHEFGHNFGIEHGKSTKCRERKYPTDDSCVNVNSEGWKDGSTMSGWGAVAAYTCTGSAWTNDQRCSSPGPERDRFNENGHFDVSNKHWYGWIEDDQV